jgi:hypothetical protein
MGTRRVKLTGIAYWSKVFPENRDLTGFENALSDVGGQTSIDIDLDKTNLDLLVKSRSMKKGTPSKENEKLTRVKFTRRWEDKIAGGPPVVLKADGQPWDYDVDGVIGNGSLVEVVLSVYDTSRRSIVGTRLEKVKVVEHKAYVPSDEDEPPAPPAAKQLAKIADNLDDEIPF